MGVLSGTGHFAHGGGIKRDRNGRPSLLQPMEPSAFLLPFLEEQGLRME